MHEAALVRTLRERVDILRGRGMREKPVHLFGAVLFGRSDGGVLRAHGKLQGRPELRQHLLSGQGVVRHERSYPRVPLRLRWGLPDWSRMRLEHRIGRVRLRLLPGPLSAVSLVTARRGTALQADGEIAQPPTPRRTEPDD